MFLTLFNKEWHEQRWRITFACTITASLVLLGFYIRLMSDQDVADATALIAALLTFLVGIGLIAPERESGTLRTLLFLPIRPRTILLAKLLIALLASLAPILTAALLALLMAAGREVPASRLLLPYALAIPLSLTLLIWTTAATVRARSEGIAGLFTIILLTLVAIVATTLDMLHFSAPACSAVNPLFFADVINNGLHKFYISSCIAQILFAILFIVILFWQFPRLGRSK